MFDSHFQGHMTMTLYCVRII